MASLHAETTLNNADSSDLQAEIASSLSSSNSTIPWRFHRQQPSNAISNALDTGSISPSPSALHPPDTSKHLRPDSPTSPIAGLIIQTDVTAGFNPMAASASSIPALQQRSPDSSHRLTNTNSIPIERTPSSKKTFVPHSFGSATSSVVSSPMLSALSDVTPLPSPLLSSDSPGPWKKLISRPTSRDVMLPVSADSALVAANGESINSAIVNAQKRRQYHGLMNTESNLSKDIREKNAEGHSRNRSISEYVPEAMTVHKQRHVTISGAQPHDSTAKDIDSSDSYMRREPHLAAQRGLAATDPLTPPQDSDELLSIPESTVTEQNPRYDYFEARSRYDNKKRTWRAIRLLGEGTFSKVMLATSQNSVENECVGGEKPECMGMDTVDLDSRKLVAIKICEHGPKGGASEERVEISLKRELDFLRTVHHPSLVNLKAWSVRETRAILVLNYCPGGDLFDVASEHPELLVPSLLQRIFSELVGAVRYLHGCHIVHRDIKLENILVNLTRAEFTKPTDWRTFPYSVITLTDLGLSRRITDDEKLMTRCGSDDYAAPEVIMGHSYDGRMVDAWSLGVVLYALLERRLPFDPPPNASAYFKQRSKTSHRIARVEWKWIEYNGDDGEHEAATAKFEKAGLLGAMRCTEALLKKARARASLDLLADDEWVTDGIFVDGGIKTREEDDSDRV